MATLSPIEIIIIRNSLWNQCETMQSNMNNAPTAELEEFWLDRFADAVDAIDKFDAIIKNNAEI